MRQRDGGLGVNSLDRRQVDQCAPSWAHPPTAGRLASPSVQRAAAAAGASASSAVAERLDQRVRTLPFLRLSSVRGDSGWRSGLLAVPPWQAALGLTAARLPLHHPVHRQRGQPGDCTLLARRRGFWRCRLAAGQRCRRRPDSHRLPAVFLPCSAAQCAGNATVIAPASCLPGGEPGGVSGGAVLEVLPCSVADCAPGCGGSAQCPAPAC